MIVLGIDPSLTATGLAVVDLDDILAPTVEVIHTTGTKGASLRSRHDRLLAIVTEATRPARVLDEITVGVVIETPSLGQARQGGTLDRNGLYWLLVSELLIQGVMVVEVPPSSRAKYATGKGNAAKGAVIDATARRLPHVETDGDDNACDAIWLAAMGADLAGRPLVDLPATHRTALDKITVPSGWAA